MKVPLYFSDELHRSRWEAAAKKKVIEMLYETSLTSRERDEVVDRIMDIFSVSQKKAKGGKA